MGLSSYPLQVKGLQWTRVSRVPPRPVVRGSLKEGAPDTTDPAPQCPEHSSLAGQNLRLQNLRLVNSMASVRGSDYEVPYLALS